ncbi:poly-beta-1,6-N-acetyl-D-glucosamine biosynthesis protein PgaD [Priestia taiwanensis]|uniref:Poly-beta-1,6-N-acetyl-D-glucosamine biosynthesis protein PgaD n=1 Tax=Priestia taiwanensis TaxID=1347902 RepID=A0A917AQS3_9BACI|nr:poly-beta-1,6-N-acetyl-D-glucosamine biosynthesis protein PgaD [Priestia taiwanensis]MBM7363072.1 biofilm PGA synthesis protein PgaD [Priestia taiwanensis]GGE67441.1 hypothetical protein GCM10007140_16930 [Priestia taiwanensis]
MDFTRQGKQKEQPVTHSYDFENEILVKTKHSFIRKIIALLFTLIFWLYTIVIFWFFLSALFNIYDPYMAIVKIAFNVTNANIRELLLLSFVLFLVSTAMLFIWRTYNKKRFGSLTRRSMPTHTTMKDWLALDLMDESDINMLQTNKVTVFYTNPVKELQEKDGK